MKRVFIFILIGLLSLPLISFAAESPFSLRNGYAWGMLPDDVLSLAEDEGLSLESIKAASTNSTMLQYSDVLVGNYRAEMWLQFQMKTDGVLRLWRAMYHFKPINSDYSSSENEDMFAALEAGLRSVYGLPSANGTGNAGDSIKWTLPDTAIGLMKLSEGVGYFCAIEYKNEIYQPESTAAPIPNSGF